MKYELNEEDAKAIEKSLSEFRGAMTNLLQRSIKDATEPDEIAAIQADIEKANRRCDDVLATLDKAKGA